MDSPRRSTHLVNALAILLGLVFVAAGMLKIPVFPEFVTTVRTLTYLAGPTARAGAVILIAGEILLGTCLILRWKLKYTPLPLLVLIAGYLWILAWAIIQQREITCHCFGILNLGLSNAHELILDLVLFNGALVVAYFAGRRPAVARTTTWFRRIAPAAVALLLGYGEYSLVAPALKSGRVEGSLNLEAALAGVSSVDTAFALRSERRLLLLLRFRDFDCSVCFADFVALADSVAPVPADSARVLALFSEEGIPRTREPASVRRWAGGAGFFFAIRIVPDSVFRRFGITRSTAILLEQDNTPLFLGELPLGAFLRERVTHSLRSPDPSKGDI